MTPKQENKKDFFDKLSSLSGVFIAIAGFMATFIYNNNQIKLQEVKANADIQAAKIDILEKCMKYVTSNNPKEREFGYSVFVINGYQDLAIKLIDAKKDIAGVIIIQDIASDRSNKFSREAKSVLSRLSPNPEQKIKQITNYFETGNFNKSYGEYDKTMIDTVIYRNVTNKAHELGIKSTLGIAALYDSYVNLGPEGITKKSIDFATTKMNGIPRNGIDETKWLMYFLTYRYDWAKNHSNILVQKTIRRPALFLELLKSNNLSLTNLDSR